MYHIVQYTVHCMYLICTIQYTVPNMYHALACNCPMISIYFLLDRLYKTVLCFLLLDPEQGPAEEAAGAAGAPENITGAPVLAVSLYMTIRF